MWEKSHTGQQTITIRILLNLSKGKGNQTMKFSQLVEYNARKNHAENEATRLAPGLLLLFIKDLYEVKLSASGLTLISIYISIALDLDIE